MVRAAMGMLSLLVGAFLVLRPFAAHSPLVLALGLGLFIGALSEIVQGTREAPARWLLGGTYLVGAAVIVFWPGIPLNLVGAIVGLILVATGALEVWSGLLSRTKLPALLVGAASGGLWVALLSGVVTLALGVLTALWADAVLLPMTITLGSRLLLVGVGLLVDVWYPPTGLGVSTERQRLAWRLIGLVVAVALFAAGLEADGGRPRPSEFYYRDIPAETAAGTLLRAEKITGVTFADGLSVRLLYATKNPAGASIATSAVLYVPNSTSAAELPLVVWAHGETGIAQGCAPSVLGEASGGLSSVGQMLAAGYAVLAPDYPGMGTPGQPSYLVGLAEGRALLDGVRATTQVPGLKLGSAVLWGHSQGGHAVLWAGQIAANYAPELRIAGVAADAPIINPAAVVAAEAKDGQIASRASYLLYSYAATYPEVKPQEYLGFADLALAEETASRCGGAGWAVQNWAAMAGATRTWKALPATGALAARLNENRAAGEILAPVLITQGSADQVVPQALTDAEVDLRCQANQALDYRIYPGLGHVTPASSDSPQFADLMAWTADRFAGRSAVNTCKQR